MDTGERLAAYLSGDLAPDERTALEAELAGDAGLRARLERIASTDQVLATLSNVDLPDGFEDRLHERLAPELDAVLGDELAARRARRATPRWLPAVGAAAALVVVVAGGISLTGGLGGDDAGDDSRVTADAGGGAEEGADMAEPFDTMQAPEAAATAGPLVVARDRTLTREDLTALAQDTDVLAAATSEAVLADPTAAAGDYAAALGVDRAFDTTEDDDGSADDDGATAARSLPPVAIRGEVSSQDRDAVTACLPVLFEDADAPVVPLYAELATDEDDGGDVIVFAALSPDANGDYRRIEVWMVERETCEPRLFLQSDVQPAERNAP